jgi:uncharacterized protein YfiM (DUF2279 family)
MAEYIDIYVEDGVALVVQVPESSEPIVVEAGRARELSEQAITSFGTTIDSIRTAAAAVIQRSKTMERQPTEVTVEFSIQLAASAGVVIASTAATANMRVAFRWSGDNA